MTTRHIPQRRDCYRHRDAGFTMPELVLTIAILGMVMAAVAGVAMIMVGLEKGVTANQLMGIGDQARLTSLVPQDFRNATDPKGPTVRQCTPTSSDLSAGTLYLSDASGNPTMTTGPCPPNDPSQEPGPKVVTSTTPSRNVYLIGCSPAPVGDPYANSWAGLTLRWKDVSTTALGTTTDINTVVYSVQRLTTTTPIDSPCQLVRLQTDQRQVAKPDGTIVTSTGPSHQNLLAMNLRPTLSARFTVAPDQNRLILDVYGSNRDDQTKPFVTTVEGTPRTTPQAPAYNPPSVDVKVEKALAGTTVLPIDPPTLWPGPYKIHVGDPDVPSATVRFDARGSVSPVSGVGLKQIQWAVAGGQIGGVVGQETFHTECIANAGSPCSNGWVDIKFPNAGSYDLAVTVLDTDYNSKSKPVHVSVGYNNPPRMSKAPTAVPRAVGAVSGHQVDFQAYGSDPDGDALTYTWVYADRGTEDDNTVSNPMHEFEKYGAYTVSVVAHDSWGSASVTTDPHTVTVTPNPKPCTLHPVADTWVDYDNNNTSHGGETTFHLRLITHLFSNDTHKWILLKFDPTATCDEGYHITTDSNATNLTGDHGPGGEVSIDLYATNDRFQEQSCFFWCWWGDDHNNNPVYAATSTWTDSTTWNTRPTPQSNNSGTQLGSLSIWSPNDNGGNWSRWSNIWRNDTLRQWIGKWYAGAQPNYGVIVECNEASDGDWTFTSKEGTTAQRPLLRFGW